MKKLANVLFYVSAVALTVAMGLSFVDALCSSTSPVIFSSDTLLSYKIALALAFLGFILVLKDEYNEAKKALEMEAVMKQVYRTW